MAQNVKTVQGLAIASVKTVKGLAIASVKTIKGVDNTAGGGSNGLLTNLSSYWKMDNGAITTDSHGSNTLTNNNGVTNATGKINDGADFEASSNQYLSVADAAGLSMGAGVDISFSFWLKLESDPGTAVILDKYGAGGNEYQCDVVTSRIFFQLRANTAVHHTTTLSTGVWYFVVCTYNATTGDMGVSINGGAAETGNEAINPSDGTTAVKIGSSDGGGFYLDGIVDEVAFWKGRVLDATDITNLYNGGSGLAYGSFD